MKRFLSCIALISALASAPAPSLATEPSLTMQHQLDAAITKHFPQSKSCAFWERELLGLRCIYIDQSGLIQIENMLYVSVSALDDGLTIIQVGDEAYVIPSETN